MSENDWMNSKQIDWKSTNCIKDETKYLFSDRIYILSQQLPFFVLYQVSVS